MSGVEVAIIAGAMAAASTAAQAYGNYQEGKYQSNVMKANADVLKHNAAQQRLETSLNEDIMREENRRKLAKLQSAMTEQGNVGATGIGVLGQSATDLEQNVLNSRYQGLASAEAMDIEANYLRKNAKLTKKQAKNRFTTTMLFGVPSSFFGGYSQMGGGLPKTNSPKIESTGGSSSSFRTYNIGG